MTHADRPAFLGVLNVSPESMVGESIATTPEAILARASFLTAHGCTWLDLGGRSITPDAPTIDDEEERARLLPALDLLVAEGYAVSVDTWSPQTAVVALQHGATMVNFTGETASSELLTAVASRGARLVLTYMPYGNAYEMRSLVPVPYRVGRIVEFLRRRVEAARDAGVRDVIIDPNLGIISPRVDDHAKVHLQYEVLSRMDELRKLGAPVLLYAARKPERLARIMMAEAVLRAGPDYVRTHHPDMLERLLDERAHSGSA